MLKLLSIAAWALAHPALYGYHIAALNGIQDAAVCAPMQTTRYGAIDDCLHITDEQLGFAVTIITLGGLCGSLGADLLIRKTSRSFTLRASEIGCLLGALGVGLANSLWLLAISRFLIGASSGLIMVAIPPFLASMSHRYKKLLGTLHQISIGAGMIIAQSLSLLTARPMLWRIELLIPAVIAAVLLVCGGGINADREEAIDGGEYENEGQERDQEGGSRGHREDEPLLREQQRNSSRDGQGQDVARDRYERKKAVGIREVFRSDIRYGALIVIVALCAQQITGISPVMFFSSKILKSTFGGNSKLVALSMMAVGIPFNFLPGILKLESKPVLLISALGTTISSLLLAIGLNTHSRVLSGLSVLGFVISFSFGLAPVAWVVLSEVVPPEARTAVGSVGVSINWLTNFTTGIIFLPLQKALGEEGDIFYVFAALSAIAVIGIWSSYRVYDKHEVLRE